MMSANSRQVANMLALFFGVTAAIAAAVLFAGG